MTLIRSFQAALLAGCLATSALVPASAQNTRPQLTPEQREAAKRRMGPPQAAPANDPSFKPIFDGQSLAGWEGDTNFWKVVDGAITGETTAENPLKANTFLIWKGGAPKDFEFVAEYRLSAVGNSGVQYRSGAIPDRQYGLRGYQADIDAENRYTGQIYEEGGRGFMAMRGQAARVEGSDDISKTVIGSLGDTKALAELIKKQDWNEIRIIARGNVLIQLINGQVMSILVDEDTKSRKFEGVIGLQLHTGPAMKIEYRNLKLKTY